MATLFDEMRISVERGIGAAKDGIRLLDSMPVRPKNEKLRTEFSPYNSRVKLIFRGRTCIGAFGVIEELGTMQTWLQIHGYKKYTKVCDPRYNDIIKETEMLFEEFCVRIL